MDKNCKPNDKDSDINALLYPKGKVRIKYNPYAYIWNINSDLSPK